MEEKDPKSNLLSWKKNLSDINQWTRKRNVQKTTLMENKFL